MWVNGSQWYQRMAFSKVILLTSSSGTLFFGQHLVELFGSARPHRVAVRVVGFPADVVDADLVAQRHPDVIGDEAGQEMLAEHLRGLLASEVLTRPRRMHLIGAVGTLKEVRDPAGAAFGQARS